MVGESTDPGEWLRENEQQVEDLADLDHESSVVARLALAYLRDEQIDADLAAEARQLLSPPEEGDTSMNYARATPTSREKPVTDDDFTSAVAYLRERLAALEREQAAADRRRGPVLTMWNRNTGEIVFQSPAAALEAEAGSVVEAREGR